MSLSKGSNTPWLYNSSGGSIPRLMPPPLLSSLSLCLPPGLCYWFWIAQEWFLPFNLLPSYSLTVLASPPSPYLHGLSVFPLPLSLLTRGFLSEVYLDNRALMLYYIQKPLSSPHQTPFPATHLLFPHSAWHCSTPYNLLVMIIVQRSPLPAQLSSHWWPWG